MTAPDGPARPVAADPLRERLAELRGEHGMARYVDDETLARWVRPAPPVPDPPGPAEPERPLSS